MVNVDRPIRVIWPLPWMRSHHELSRQKMRRECLQTDFTQAAIRLIHDYCEAIEAGMDCVVPA